MGTDSKWMVGPGARVQPPVQVGQAAGHVLTQCAECRRRPQGPRLGDSQPPGPPPPDAEALGNAPSEALAGTQHPAAPLLPRDTRCCTDRSCSFNAQTTIWHRVTTEFHVPPDSRAKALTPSAMVLGGAALGESLRLGEVIR